MELDASMSNVSFRAHAINIITLSSMKKNDNSDNFESDHEKETYTVISYDNGLSIRNH